MSNPNPSSSTARRLRWLAAAGLALAIALPAVSGELYQWKDANGVTHYSDAPPPAGADYKNRTIGDHGSASVAAEEAEAPAESSQCTSARANLALLQGDGPVGADTDNDGKPDAAFSADERAAQTELAEAAIKVHCTAAVASTGADSPGS